MSKSGKATSTPKTKSAKVAQAGNIVFMPNESTGPRSIRLVLSQSNYTPQILTKSQHRAQFQSQSQSQSQPQSQSNTAIIGSTQVINSSSVPPPQPVVLTHPPLIASNSTNATTSNAIMSSSNANASVLTANSLNAATPSSAP